MQKEMIHDEQEQNAKHSSRGISHQTVHLPNVTTRLVHSADESVDSLATVTSVAALGVVGELLALEAAVGVRELEAQRKLVTALKLGPQVAIS